MGGDSSHPIVVGVAAGLARLGWEVATPDLHDPDVSAAAASVEERAAALGTERVALVGYSWGSVVASHAKPPGLCARVLIAPPAAMPLGATLHAIPFLALVPENDQYGGPAATTIAHEVVAGADHFLWSALDAFIARTVEWLTASHAG